MKVYSEFITHQVIIILFTIMISSCAPIHITKSALTDHKEETVQSEGTSNDASKMSETPVRSVVPINPENIEEQIKSLLQEASTEGWKVSIAGSQHSMGGHTLYPGGVVLDMTPFTEMELIEDNTILKVGSGATWAQIIPYLHANGRSVWIMQSNNDFSVGGSISVNCHGWQHRRPPIASTVRSFRIIKADGEIIQCSRNENSELFSLALGGYGLFGVILEVELITVPNIAYRTETYRITPSEFTAEFYKRLEEHPKTGMVYGRLSIDEERFLTEATLNLLIETEAEIPETLDDTPSLAWLRRAIFRGSAGSDYGKKLRWDMEKKWSERMGSGTVSRNQILNETSTVYSDQSAETVDIIQEYFVPQDRLEDFLVSAREIIPRHNSDLLNVTIRDLAEDHDTFLRYADQDMFALVMLFNQKQTPEDEERMTGMTEDLIDAALNVGGRYYLPYRLHATQKQFEQAYPMAQEFFEAKRQYDPNEIFQNKFYLTYGKSP